MLGVERFVAVDDLPNKFNEAVDCLLGPAPSAERIMAPHNTRPQFGASASLFGAGNQLSALLHEARKLLVSLLPKAGG